MKRYIFRFMGLALGALALVYGLISLMAAVPADALAAHGDLLTLGLPGLALPALGFAGLIINQASLNDLFVAFQAAFNTGFRDAKPLWDRIATLVPSGTRENHYAWLGQFPQLREWIGDRQIKDMTAHDYRIVNKTYEGTVGVPREDIEDDQFGIYAPLMQEMGFSAARHPDELIFALLAAGFTTLCYDGQNFFDTDHPVAGASVSNSGGGAGTAWFLLDVGRVLRPLIYQRRREYALQALLDPADESVFMRKEYRYGVDGRCNVGFGFWQQAYASKDTLNATNYAAARAAMQSFKSDEGRPLSINPNLLVVPPTLEGAGRAILLAERDASGATNIWKGSAELLMAPQLA